MLYVSNHLKAAEPIWFIFFFNFRNICRLLWKEKLKKSGRGPHTTILKFTMKIEKIVCLQHWLHPTD